MTKKTAYLMMTIIVAFSFSQRSFAQSDIEFDMQKFYGPSDDPTLANQNLNDAVTPLLDLFGFLSGGGLSNTAEVHSFLGFDAGIKFAAMRVGDDQLPFLPRLDEVDKKLENGPLGGENIIGLPILHVGVGLLANLEAVGRFFTYPMGNDQSVEGNVTLIGLGVKYGILQNIALPKVAIIATYHYLNMPKQFDFGNVNNFSGELIVSKGLPFVTFYASAGIDYTTLELQLPPPLPNPDPYNKTNFRGNVGLRLTLIPFTYINVDYNFGAVQGLCAGLGISVR